MVNVGLKLWVGFMFVFVSGLLIKVLRKIVMLIIVGFLVVRMFIIRIKVMIFLMKKVLYSDIFIWIWVILVSREWLKIVFRYSVVVLVFNN